MRYLLLGLALASLCTQAFGQSPAQEKPGLPSPTLLDPPAAAPRTLTAPGEGLPFKNWQDLLKKNPASTERVTLALNAKAPGWQASGQCSVPLVNMQLPEHFDDAMVQKLPRHYDDKMLLATPPVCPLHDDRAQSAKRK